MAQEVILRLDTAQEHRQLSDAQYSLRAKLKKRLLGWATIEKARKKQCSRISYLREGDANTKFFRLKVNSRKRKNFIQRLRNGNGWAISHEAKQEIIHDHFSNLMSTPPQPTRDFNWDHLSFPQLDLEPLAAAFTEDEILHAIKQMPQDKAPGPDGFTGLFYKSCWPIIKNKVMAAVNSFHNLRCSNLNLVNKANIVLIPKKDGADRVHDYRPISLIHGVAKIINMALAIRLAPYMSSLIFP